jgi:hypothetical protein
MFRADLRFGNQLKLATARLVPVADIDATVQVQRRSTLALGVAGAVGESRLCRRQSATGAP